MTTSAARRTALVRAWSAGSDGALDDLIPLVEREPRRHAKVYMRRERPDHTLQTTALVNEAFVRLIGARDVEWQDRAPFLGIAARLMRRVLVDHARTHHVQKRGGGARAMPLEEAILVSPPLHVELLALDRALDALATRDQRKCQVVEIPHEHRPARELSLLALRGGGARAARRRTVRSSTERVRTLPRLSARADRASFSVGWKRR